MNRSAYLTTSLAIKAIENLSKADVVLHDAENIPNGPTIFVVNHFTRIETFLLPYHIYTLTGKPVWSLAHASLFHGGLGRFFDLVGVISTNDPRRDELIVKTLLTDEANWIIFPEGSMMKTKKIMARGKYVVIGSASSGKGRRKPHTGAASLALRCELFRRYLQVKGRDHEEEARGMLDFLGIGSLDEVREKSATIVPVNMTYYPIRARENIVSVLAEKMVRDLPERAVEEIMTEGTMLLSGVDIDVRFGRPIEIGPYLERRDVRERLQRQDMTGFLMSPALKEVMRELSEEIMQRYMRDIYAMTTVNHEHLFASLLRVHSRRRISEDDLRKRVFLAASRVSDLGGEGGIYLHKSLQEDQCHLLTNDRFGKVANFLELAREKKILSRTDNWLTPDRTRLSAPLSFHRGRIDNPIEIMANEVEPLGSLRKLMTVLALQPRFLVRLGIVRYLLKKERALHEREYRDFGYGDDLERKSYGRPFLLPCLRRKTGVVLVHSYLAAPEEVRKLGRYLRGQGMWVHAPRLPGHGTSSSDLAGRCYEQWIEAVENSYILLETSL